MNELMQSWGVLSVRLSVNFYMQVATSTTNMTQSPPNLHTMVPRWACIKGVLKVKVKGRLIRTLFWLHENRFFCHEHDSIATKLAHDGPHIGLHPACARGQGQRSRDTGTSVMSQNVCYTVPSDVLSLRTLTLRSTVTLSFQCKCQTARCNVHIMEWATPSLMVWWQFDNVLVDFWPYFYCACAEDCHFWASGCNSGNTIIFSDPHFPIGWGYFSSLSIFSVSFFFFAKVHSISISGLLGLFSLKVFTFYPAEDDDFHQIWSWLRPLDLKYSSACMTKVA